MLKDKILVFALLYCVLAIVFKLVILLGGFIFTKFGFYYSNVVSVVFIIPFIWLTIRSVRAQNGGVIGGKSALQTGLKMAMLAALIMAVYNYIEFQWKLRDLSIEYYNSDMFKAFLMKNAQLKPEKYTEIIQNAIRETSTLSPFQVITIKLIPLLFFSVSTAFICAVFMKRAPSPSLN